MTDEVVVWRLFGFLNFSVVFSEIYICFDANIASFREVRKNFSSRRRWDRVFFV